LKKFLSTQLNAEVSSLSLKIEHLALWQTRAAAEVLCRAFWEDPFFLYLFPERAERARGLLWFYKVSIGYGLRYGEVLTTAGLDGVAVWLPPGATKISFGKRLRSGMSAAPFKLGWAAYRRLLKAFQATKYLHEQIIAAPHWYLMALGVEPSKQRQKIGGALIRPVLERADEQVIPCHLETWHESNIGFYQKHGFRVVAKKRLSERGPWLWAMVRF
jgi:ribosomal protein S18 acetylase RimI-like enzyme